MSKAVYGISNFKMGPTGVAGAMGATLADITKIVADSVNVDFPEAAETDFTPEEANSPEVILQTPGVKKVTIETMNIDVANLSKFFGGAVVTATGTSTYTPGVNYSLPEQSFQFTTRPLQGASQTWQFPRATCLVSITSNPSKTKLITLKLSFTVQQPYDASGVALPDFGIIQQTV